MEWTYDSRQRCWRLSVGDWAAQVERWPASLEYLAQLTSSAGAIIRAPHVFVAREAAQGRCLEEIARQRAP